MEIRANHCCAEPAFEIRRIENTCCFTRGIHVQIKRKVHQTKSSHLMKSVTGENKANTLCGKIDFSLITDDSVQIRYVQKELNCKHRFLMKHWLCYIFLPRTCLLMVPLFLVISNYLG